MAYGISVEIAGDNMFSCKMNLQSWGGLSPPFTKVGGGGFSPSCPPVPTPMMVSHALHWKVLIVLSAEVEFTI